MFTYRSSVILWDAMIDVRAVRLEKEQCMDLNCLKKTDDNAKKQLNSVVF